MFVDIKYLENLKFNECENCIECCNKLFAPLVLEDFKKVYEYFPIVFVNLDFLKPVMIISDGVNYCKYLENEKCSIYENRPPACRIYPFSPFYDKLLLDVSCKAVGIEGESLPMNFEEYKKSIFFESRVVDIEEKINELINWLDGKNFIKFCDFKGFELYKLDKENDEYSKMHLHSLKNFDY